ncbi:MAG: hypothetical protein ACQSGP_18875 [Frankia sp.]
MTTASSGSTRPAGEGIDDAEAARQVARQTSSDRKVSDVFERESDGAASDIEAAKSDGADLGG